MRQQGATVVGTMIALLVVAIAGLILYYINSQVMKDRYQADDIKKMRSIYVGISLYQGLNDDYPPPNLALTQRDVGPADTYGSFFDPFRKGTEFPMDPAFPTSTERNSFRISFTYLPQWTEHNKYKVRNWRTVMSDPAYGRNLGLLACYWNSTSTNSRADGLDSKGEELRVNIDGSIKIVDHSGSQGLLDAKAIFATN